MALGHVRSVRGLKEQLIPEGSQALTPLLCPPPCLPLHPQTLGLHVPSHWAESLLRRQKVLVW